MDGQKQGQEGVLEMPGVVASVPPPFPTEETPATHSAARMREFEEKTRGLQRRRDWHRWLIGVIIGVLIPLIVTLSVLVTMGYKASLLGYLRIIWRAINYLFIFGIGVLAGTCVVEPLRSHYGLRHHFNHGG